MSTRREFLKYAVVGSLATPISEQLAQAAELDEKHTKAGKYGYNSSRKIRAVIRREETLRRYDGNGDNWHMTWASDDHQYVSLCDGAGFTDQSSELYNTRLFAIRGGPQDAQFQELSSYPKLARPTTLGPKDPRYYGFGTLAIDGYIYQFLSTLNRPSRSDDSKNVNPADLLCFNGVKLIYSPDNGRTWHNQDGSTPVVWEHWEQRSRDTMVFFEENQRAFSLLTVLQMGKNYEHNRDGYVYVYSPNGYSEGTMNELVMFRVARRRLRDRASYEYFAGRRSDGTVSWTKDINARAVVHTFPRGWVNTLAHPYAWHPSVVYNAPLGLYLMANWGMGGTPDGMWFGRPSYLGFWIAVNPWGPWTQIHEETAWKPNGDLEARAYQPQISPKWIAADGKHFWLVWTDMQGSEEYWRQMRSLSSYAEHGKADVSQTIIMMRKYLPYYAFNVQRVDLVLG